MTAKNYLVGMVGVMAKTFITKIFLLVFLMVKTKINMRYIILAYGGGALSDFFSTASLCPEIDGH